MFPRVCVLILQPVTYSFVDVTLFGSRVDTVWFFIRQIPETHRQAPVTFYVEWEARNFFVADDIWSSSH